MMEEVAAQRRRPAGLKMKQLGLASLAQLVSSAIVLATWALMLGRE